MEDTKMDKHVYCRAGLISDFIDEFFGKYEDKIATHEPCYAKALLMAAAGIVKSADHRGFEGVDFKEVWLEGCVDAWNTVEEQIPTEYAVRRDS